ncbi:MAG: hypothetical protein Q4F69_07535 [Bacteroidia bacterium]|nr:hypothetical protein [Bacteroidia bacterium]
MKKVALLLAASALMLGLSQCSKRPNMPVGYVGHTETIEFTTGGGEKGGFDQVSNALQYKWDIDNSDGKTDSLHVYAQDGVNEFTSGFYLGSIPIVAVDPADPYKATFKGDLDNVPESGVLRFVHVGQDVAVDKGAANISFADQDGSLGTISQKVLAVCDITYDKIKPFDADLDVQFAVCKLDLSGFGTPDRIDMSCIVNNGLGINEKGVVSYKPGTYSNLNDVKSSTNPYYAVLMPIDGSKCIVLSCKGSDGKVLTSSKLQTDFVANKFYTKKENPGESFKPETNTPVPGLIPGVFTIGERKSIHFSQGNLYYNHNTTRFIIENNQMYFPTCYMDDHVTHFHFCQTWQYAVQKDYINENIPEAMLFTNASAEEPNAGFDVYVGDNVVVTGFYRVLSTSEIGYMMNQRKVYVNNEAKVPYGLATVSAGANWSGLVILPDNWDGSVCPDFPYGTRSYADKYFTDVEWAKMEAAGAVFLPAAGYRVEETYYQNADPTKRGLYMLSEHCNPDGNYYYNFWNDPNDYGIMTHHRYWGCSIRLICDSNK